MEIEEIIDLYYKKVYKLCLFYLNNKEEAEELLHEILIKILNNFHTFKGNSSIYTWIYRIAVNTIFTFINKKKILDFISFDHLNPVDKKIENDNFQTNTEDPAVLWEKEEIRNIHIKKLENCIKRLSNREKTVFYFFYYDQIKQKEIASILNTSVSAVESLVHKAVKKIKGCVNVI